MPSIQPTPLPLPYEIYHELIADLARVVPSFTFDTIATKCIDLYFEYLFPLIPIVHGPDLREGLNIWVNYAQQAERPNAGIWPAPPSILESMGTSHGRNEQHYVASLFTLVTALCAESASMVPVQFFPEGPLISNTFLHASRKALQEYLEADIDQPNSRSLATRYFHSNCLHAAGKQRLSWHIFGEAARLAQVMKLNEESSYDGLDPIEAQLRKRAFWILYMGDKSAAILNDRPITLHKFSFESGITASYADEVGNYAGQMMQSPSSPNPPGRSLITGFNFNLRLWQAASDLLLEIRLMNDAGYNQGVGKLSISEQRSHISNFYIHFMTCLDELPPWLQIDLTAFTTKENSTAYSREFLIQQVNLRVSFHCLKMVIIKKFEDAGFSTSGIGLEHSKTLALTKTEIARDMVRAMQEAPFWALQVNGESCVGSFSKLYCRYPYREDLTLAQVEKIRIIGASLLKVIHNNRDSPIEVRARVEFVVLLDILTRLDSKASDGLRDGSF